MKHTRAYVDRAAMEPDGTGPIRFVAATEGRKADGIDLKMAGAELDRYRGNPVVGYGHSYWGRENLPIGRATEVTVDGDRLLIDVEFDQADEFAVQVERKYRAGFLNAVSIGFDVIAWENENDNTWRGGVAEEWVLTELSCVPIPMDADAVVESGRAAVDGSADAILRALYPAALVDAIDWLKQVRDAPLDMLPRDYEPEAVPEAPAEGVNPDAARALLAAFTTEENPS